MNIHTLLLPQRGYDEQRQNDQAIYVKPKQKIAAAFLDQLKQINDKYSKTKNFSHYQSDICKLFKLMPLTKKNRDTLFYLAGFFEGEASLNVGAKKNLTSQFGFFLDPEFNVTQHINGISNLFLAMYVFQTGRIRFKSGSLATFVYTIDNRQALEEKVIPFYEKYINLYGSRIKLKRVKLFKQFLKLFRDKAHWDKNRMINEMLPLWHALRMQSNSNQTFKDLVEAKQWINTAMQLKSKFKTK